MRGQMTTLGTIKPSGDKEALHYKLIHTTTAARVILCKDLLELEAVVSPTPRFRCQNNHREGPNIFSWLRVNYNQMFLICILYKQPGRLTQDLQVVPKLKESPAGKMKLEFLENPSSTFLGYSRISNLIQAYLWDFS